MTTHPRSRARSPGVHDHPRGDRGVHARRAHATGGSGCAGRRGSCPPGGPRRQAARRSRESAARLGALGRARVDAWDARHRPEPRTERRVGHPAGRSDWRRALCRGLLNREGSTATLTCSERLPENETSASRSGRLWPALGWSTTVSRASVTVRLSSEFRCSAKRCATLRGGTRMFRHPAALARGTGCRSGARRGEVSRRGLYKHERAVAELRRVLEQPGPGDSGRTNSRSDGSNGEL
jgi:hypothetical protein